MSKSQFIKKMVAAAKRNSPDGESYRGEYRAVIKYLLDNGDIQKNWKVRDVLSYTFEHMNPCC